MNISCGRRGRQNSAATIRPKAAILRSRKIADLVDAPFSLFVGFGARPQWVETYRS